MIKSQTDIANMLQMMADTDIISQTIANNLMNKYLADGRDRRFTLAVVKQWSYKTSFFKRYEQAVLTSWSKLKEHLKNTNIKPKVKPQPQAKTNIQRRHLDEFEVAFRKSNALIPSQLLA